MRKVTETPLMASPVVSGFIILIIPMMFTFISGEPPISFNTTKLSLSLNIGPSVLNLLFRSLQAAKSDAGKVTQILLSAESSDIVGGNIGALQDCEELHQKTVSSLQKADSWIRSGDPEKIPDARIHLSAVLTDRATCLEGLESASGSLKSEIISLLNSIYTESFNSLSLLPNPTNSPHRRRRRRLLKFPTWVSHKDRRILGSFKVQQYNSNGVITVAKDGTGNFTTISDAISFAPLYSNERIFIYIKSGFYQENVEIPINKPNIVLLGDGRDATFITGKRSVRGGWTTFRSATLAVSGDGFLARDITIENTAGAKNHQAVALRLSADLAALYKCTFSGYQDTLYVHSYRQFFRECDVYGTIDYIFGNAAAVLQSCNIVSLLPMPGQFVAVTAQGRESPVEDTGISIQNCSILATEELYHSSVKSYLGRPWKPYSRTVVIDSYIDDFIDPRGWAMWNGKQGLDSLYYGEYNNYGPGSNTSQRVNWAGYHRMGYDDAFNFTVPYFLTSNEWLGSTSVPYDESI